MILWCRYCQKLCLNREYISHFRNGIDFIRIAAPHHRSQLRNMGLFRFNHLSFRYFINWCNFGNDIDHYQLCSLKVEARNLSFPTEHVMSTSTSCFSTRIFSCWSEFAIDMEPWPPAEWLPSSWTTIMSNA